MRLLWMLQLCTILVTHIALMSPDLLRERSLQEATRNHRLSQACHLDTDCRRPSQWSQFGCGLGALRQYVAESHPRSL